MAGTVYFCGCMNRVGHYTYGAGKKPAWRDSVGPWRTLDSPKTLTPYRGSKTGDANLTHLEGWTALGITDNTIDSRPASHSTFACEGIFTFEEMLALVREAWPQILNRIEAVAPITLKNDAPWFTVKRTQTRPDLLCISCSAPVGQRHGVACYTSMIERQSQKQKAANA